MVACFRQPNGQSLPCHTISLAFFKDLVGLTLSQSLYAVYESKSQHLSPFPLTRSNIAVIIGLPNPDFATIPRARLISFVSSAPFKTSSPQQFFACFWRLLVDFASPIGLQVKEISPFLYMIPQCKRKHVLVFHWGFRWPDLPWRRCRWVHSILVVGVLTSGKQRV